MSNVVISTKVVILRLLKDSPMHGYQLTKEIEKIFGKEPSAGSLHPLLTKLESDGLIASSDSVEHGRYKKIFSITKIGLDALHESTATIMGFLKEQRAV